MKLSVFHFVLMVFCFGQDLSACTAFNLTAQDGAPVYCRSMEFEYTLNSKVLIVPRNTSFAGTYNEAVSGIKYVTQYGFVGLNQSLSPTVVSDGMNEKGLVVGCLYLPGLAEYAPLELKKKDKTLAPWELANYLLGTCATVDEVRIRLNQVIVGIVPLPGFKNFIIPLHFWVSDSAGRKIVIEFKNGKPVFFDNSVGVLTNSPGFDWHLLNLSNYLKLKPSNADPFLLDQFKITPVGQGSGLVGIPGDYTPPSRFVKAAFFKTFAKSMPTALDAVMTGFHILNTFDIFEGIILDGQNANQPPLAEITQWVVVHDQKNLRSYVRTYQGQNIQKIDFNKLNFMAKKPYVIALTETFNVEDISLKSIPLN